VALDTLLPTPEFGRLTLHGPFDGIVIENQTLLATRHQTLLLKKN
jgi:erythronate-4-phosphate dehydrogenase